MYTTHGYEVPNTTPAEYTPLQFEQCGGIGTCEQCTREAETLTNENAKAITEQFFPPSLDPEDAIATATDEEG